MPEGRRVSWGDYDGDGFQDLIYGSHLYKNDGDGSWSAAADLSLGDGQLEGLIIADLFMVDESHPGRLKTEGDSDA